VIELATIIDLDRPAHFFTPDGEPIELSPGAYRVHAGSEGILPSPPLIGGAPIRFRFRRRRRFGRLLPRGPQNRIPARFALCAGQ
jgi:hypothetical protein